MAVEELYPWMTKRHDAPPYFKVDSIRDSRVGSGFPVAELNLPRFAAVRAGRSDSGRAGNQETTQASDATCFMSGGDVA